MPPPRPAVSAATRTRAQNRPLFHAVAQQRHHCTPSPRVAVKPASASAATPPCALQCIEEQAVIPRAAHGSAPPTDGAPDSVYHI